MNELISGLQGKAKRKAYFKPKPSVYKPWLASLKVGDRVSVLTCRNIKPDTVQEIIPGPNNLITCHGGTPRKVIGTVIKLKHGGTFSAENGDGLVSDDFAIIPPKDEYDRHYYRGLYGDDSICGRMKWFSPQYWDDETVCRVLATILAVEWERPGHGWFENHFRERDDRPTTIEILRRAVDPENVRFVDEHIKPWEDKYLAEYGERDRASREAREAKRMK